MQDALETIRRVKREMGARLMILAHHYQRKEIVRAADSVGDSYALAKAAAASQAEKIAFCGVHFMAESAALLAGPGQQVFMPEPRAGCPMADMAQLADVESALETLRRASGDRGPVPVCYVNSSAEVKAAVGRRGGICCTSANAGKALLWAAQQGGRILFLPDEHLGRNTAARLGLGPIAVWNPLLDNGGLSERELREIPVIVWRGYCHVHTHFTAEMVRQAREQHPGGRVVVHPECKAAVVELAEAVGATSGLVREVETAGPGSVTVVGTEVNLVLRLAEEFPDRTVLPLDFSLCPNMYVTTPQKLAALLTSFEDRCRVEVAAAVAADARLALARMLSF
jgi:quinolinate synthase